MANYLPVLLVSVTAGMPDDASLQPLPRGQVDYLSHDWAEEDVWRSWRSMTKQKHEIANGVRLENASWRTWMKQRNKLKTVSPETLNWLKDSDVTWLYGPLHTAVDWSPPSKPDISPPVSQQAKDDTSAKATSTNSFSSPSSSTNLSHLNQARDRLGLHHEGTTKKPILKHRSIAEMLTSALPPAPLWAEESNEFADDHSFPRSHEGKDGTGVETTSQHERLEASSTSARPTRPHLFHTKSDTNILTTYGRGGVPKKPSPPRGSSHRESEAAAPQVHPGSLSASQRTGASNNLAELMHGTGASSHLTEPQSSVSPFRNAAPLDSAESSGASVHEVGRADSDSGVLSPTASVPPQKKHISFNAIVEQCIAIDSETAPTSPPSRGQSWSSYDDDGYVEDTEDGLYEDVGPGLGDDSDSEDDSQPEAEDEDEVIEIKPPSRRLSFTNEQEDTGVAYETQRQSPVNNSPSVHPDHPRFHQSSAASGRPRRPRHSGSTGSGSGSGSNSGRSSEVALSRSNAALDREHITIAPIAPTILKTGGAEDNEDGVLYMGGMPYSGYSASHGIVYGSGALPVNRGSGSGGLYDSPSGYGYGYGGYGFGECVSAGRSDAFEQFERGTEAGELVYQSPNGNVYPWGEGDAVRFRMRTEYGYAGSPRGSPSRGHGHRARQRSPSFRVGTAGVPPSSSTSNATRFASGPLVKEPSSEGFTDEAEFEYFDAAEGVQNSNEHARGSDNRESGSRSLSRAMDDVRIIEPNPHSGANNVDQRSSQFLEPGLPRERTPSPDLHPKLNPRIASLKHESSYRSASPSSSSSSATDIAGTILSHTSSTTAIPTPGISPAHQEEFARMISPPESPVLHAGLLSPDMSPRGRSLCTSPVSGSATSSSVVRSTSRSGSESRSESRGRSRTRNSSLNSSPEQGEPERGRSRSRSNTSAVHAVHSPLSDSSSPQARHPPLAIGGIGVGLGIGSGFGVQHSGREVHDGRGVPLYRKTSEDFIGRHVQQDEHMAHSARGRNRDGKRISESLSPPFVGSSATDSSIAASPSSGTYRSSVQKSHSTGTVEAVSSAESYLHRPSGSDSVLSPAHIFSSPELSPSSRSPPSISRRHMAHEVSGNSSRSMQTSLPPRPVSSTIVQGGLILPPSIPEEEEQRVRRTPDSDRSTATALPSPATSLGGSGPEGVSAAPISATVQASSASGNTDEGAGKKFANRTAELVSSARTLLGNIWNPSS